MDSQATGQLLDLFSRPDDEARSFSGWNLQTVLWPMLHHTKMNGAPGFSSFLGPNSLCLINAPTLTVELNKSLLILYQLGSTGHFINLAMQNCYFSISSCLNVKRQRERTLSERISVFVCTPHAEPATKTHIWLLAWDPHVD